MTRFDISLAFVLKEEGGYSDNPDDPGGATNKGITQRVYDQWRVKQGLPTQLVKAIGDDEVRAIYQAEYWVPAQCPNLPASVDLMHFNVAVNAGVEGAGKMLQTAVGMTGPDVDGHVGPHTLSAVHAANPTVVLGHYAVALLTHYLEDVVSNPSQITFLKDWVRRTGDVLAST